MAKVKITETVLRDSHQSLIATRMTTEEILPVLEKLDAVGYHSLEGILLDDNTAVFQYTGDFSVGNFIRIQRLLKAEGSHLYRRYRAVGEDFDSLHAGSS